MNKNMTIHYTTDGERKQLKITCKQLRKEWRELLEFSSKAAFLSLCFRAGNVKITIGDEIEIEDE